MATDTFLYRVRQPDGFHLFDTPEEAEKQRGETDLAIHAVEPAALKLPAGYWTEAEARERWRPLADAIRRCYSLGPGSRLEIGGRNYPAIIAAPTRNTAPFCDDLVDFARPTDLFRWRKNREKGLVHHVYISRGDRWGDVSLVDVEVVWLGNDTHPPAALK